MIGLSEGTEGFNGIFLPDLRWITTFGRNTHLE